MRAFLRLLLKKFDTPEQLAAERREIVLLASLGVVWR